MRFEALSMLGLSTLKWLFSDDRLGIQRQNSSRRETMQCERVSPAGFADLYGTLRMQEYSCELWRFVKRNSEG